MNIRLVIDEAGRVMIPKPLREELQLAAGDALEMESAGEQITLRPVRSIRHLSKEHGVWVFCSGQPYSPLLRTTSCNNSVRSATPTISAKRNEGIS